MTAKTLNVYCDVAAQSGAREKCILGHLGAGGRGTRPGLTIKPMTPGYLVRYFNGRDA